MPTPYLQLLKDWTDQMTTAMAALRQKLGPLSQVTNGPEFQAVVAEVDNVDRPLQAQAKEVEKWVNAGG